MSKKQNTVIEVCTLPFWKKLMYAFGQFGWSLTSFAVGNALVYFYLPPETSGATFPAFFYQGAVFFGLTFIGLALGVSRLFDAVTDPLVAGLSDRSQTKFGRRRKYLAISVAPFSILSVLVFLPISGGTGILNILWLFFTILLFYWFMTLYVTPFFAWMSELGHTPDERLLLSTMISITWAAGFALGSQIYLFQSFLENAGLAPTQAFQSVVAMFAVIGFVFMLFPIVFINESKYCLKSVSKEGIFEAVLSAFKNRNFLYFTLSDLFYWVALTGISTCLIYYVTILLEQPKEFASFMQLLMFSLSLIFYIPVNFLARKFGKKNLLSIGFLLFCLTYVVVFFLGKMAFVRESLQGYLLVFFASIPLAIFGILPNAMIADIAEADGRTQGNYKAAIFFGARTFMSKMGQTVAGLIFPSFLILGMSAENDFGVRLTAVIALIFALCGFLFLIPYNEKEIKKILEKP